MLRATRAVARVARPQIRALSTEPGFIQKCVVPKERNLGTSFAVGDGSIHSFGFGVPPLPE